MKAILKKKPVLPIKEKNAALENIAKEPEKDNTQTTDANNGIEIGDALTIEDLQKFAPINEQLLEPTEEVITVPEEFLADDELADKESTGFQIPDFGEDDTEAENNLPVDEDFLGEPDVIEPIMEEPEIEEPVMEIVAGEAEVDSIEEDIVEKPEVDEPKESEETYIDDTMFGSIDINDLPEDIPENLDEEYDRKMAERAAKKKTPGRKKSDKTVKTTKKKPASKTTAKKSTTKKK